MQVYNEISDQSAHGASTWLITNLMGRHFDLQDNALKKMGRLPVLRRSFTYFSFAGTLSQAWALFVA